MGPLRQFLVMKNTPVPRNDGSTQTRQKYAILQKPIPKPRKVKVTKKRDIFEDVEMPVLRSRSPTPQNASDVEMPRAELMQNYESDNIGPIRTNTRAQRKYKPNYVPTAQLRKIDKNIKWDNLSHNEDFQKVTEQIRKNNEENDDVIDDTTEETVETPDQIPDQTVDTNESLEKLDENIERKQKRRYDTTVPSVVLRKESIPRKLKVVPRKADIKWDNLEKNDSLNSKPDWDKVDEASKTSLPDSDEDQF